MTIEVLAVGCTEMVGDPGGEFVITSDLVDSAESKYVVPFPTAVIETLYAVESARDAKLDVLIVALVPVLPVSPVVVSKVPIEL